MYAGRFHNFNIVNACLCFQAHAKKGKLVYLLKCFVSYIVYCYDIIAYSVICANCPAGVHDRYSAIHS